MDKEELDKFIAMDHREVIKKYFKKLCDKEITPAQYRGILDKHRQLNKTIDNKMNF